VRIWLALLVASMLALADQGVSYAAAGWACAREHAIAGHGVHALFLAATIGTALAAWRVRAETRAAADERDASRHFLAGIGIASAALAALVIIAMWLAHAWISPCNG